MVWVGAGDGGGQRAGGRGGPGVGGTGRDIDGEGGGQGRSVGAVHPPQLLTLCLFSH